MRRTFFWRLPCTTLSTYRASHFVRNGLTAASAAVPKQLGQKGRSDDNDGNILETQGPQNYPESVTEHLQCRDEDSIGLIGDIAAETKVQPTRKESATKVLEQDIEAWIESWGTPQEYVDYNVIAKERVSTARRTRGSDLSRGPTCPVCSG